MSRSRGGTGPRLGTLPVSTFAHHEAHSVRDGSGVHRVTLYFAASKLIKMNRNRKACRLPRCTAVDLLPRLRSRRFAWLSEKSGDTFNPFGRCLRKRWKSFFLSFLCLEERGASIRSSLRAQKRPQCFRKCSNMEK